MVSRMMNGVSCDIPAELRRIAKVYFGDNCSRVCSQCGEPCTFDILLTAAEMIEESSGGLPPSASARDVEREFFSLIPHISQIREDLQGLAPISLHPCGVDGDEGE